jgi:hypothetical protein
MPTIWDDNIRNTHSSGDLYAYAYGVCQGLFYNLEQGNRDQDWTLATYKQLRADVDARLQQLEEIGEALVLADRNARREPPFVPTPEPTTGIYVSDETPGEQTSE